MLYTTDVVSGSTSVDVSLLRAVHQLTETAHGRPPTLAELAVALGMKASSRANVSRRLQQMQPDYVNWSSTPRSLRLTPAGEASIGLHELSTSGEEATVSDIILPLLACGLTQLIEQANSNKLVAPYPRPWQRGLNILASECLLHGVNPFDTSAEVMSWCKRPLKQWPVKFPDMTHTANEALLEDDQPSALCRELARGLPENDAEQELCEQMMAHIRVKARARRDQPTYVTLRRFLIENPVITRQSLLTASLQINPAFGEDLLNLYERVPTTLVENGHLLCCGHCGWTLSRTRRRLHCGDDRCGVLTARFTRGTKSLIWTDEAEWVRVRRAIRRYVVSPGRYEVAAYRRLEAIGVGVTLWPNYDTYDLQITFPGHPSSVWAVDIKDWRFPHLLARHIRAGGVQASDHDEVLPYSRFFYVVPDERLQDDASYITFLESAINSRHYTFMTISGLIEAARDHAGLHGDIHTDAVDRS